MADTSDQSNAEPVEASPTPADGSGADEAPTSPSLEDLQRQLAEMEATQSELVSRLQQQTGVVEPQLDHRLAFMEEQFRSSFDDRLRSTALPPAVVRRGLDVLPGGAPDTADVLLVNRVLREVSRLMGDEWRPVFDALVSPLPPDVVDAARQQLDQQPPLIQGYRSLLSWREAAGQDFDLRRLVDVLRQCNMEDVADAAVSLIENRDKKDQQTKQTKPVQRRKSDVTTKTKTGILDNRRMLLLAKKVGADWEPLGKALGVADDELAEIRDGVDGGTYQGAFKMLWAWRQTQAAGDEAASSDALRAALQQVNKEQLIEQITAN